MNITYGLTSTNCILTPSRLLPISLNELLQSSTKDLSIESSDSKASLSGSRFALAFLIAKTSVRALIASSCFAPVVVPVIFLITF